MSILVKRPYQRWFTILELNSSSVKSAHLRILFIASFLGLTLFNITSCTRRAPIAVPLTSFRFESPEMSITSKELNLGIGIHYQNEIVIVHNAAANPPVFDTPYLKQEDNFPRTSFHLGIPIFKKIEVSYDTNNGLMLRAQLAGERRNMAQAGDLSAAIAFAYNYSNSTGEELIDNYSGYTTAKYDWKMFTYSANVMLGARVRENILIYGGPIFSSYELNGDLFQIPYRYSYDTINEFNLKGNGYQAGFGLAFEFLFEEGRTKQALIYQLQVSQVGWDNYTSDVQINNGIMVKYYF